MGLKVKIITTMITKSGRSPDGASRQESARAQLLRASL